MTNENIINIGTSGELLRDTLDRVLKEDPEATVRVEISKSDIIEVIKEGTEKVNFSISAEIGEFRYSPEEIETYRRQRLKFPKFNIALRPRSKFLMRRKTMAEE